MDKVADMNRRVQINKYIWGVDAYGGNQKQAVLQYTVWAKIENNSGSRGIDNSALTFSNNYTITKRYEQSRPLQADDEIREGEKIYTIQAIKYDNEGRRFYEYIQANKSETTTSTQQDTVPIVGADFHYTGTGIEYTIPTGILNFGKPLVFRDGIQYTVILSGDPSGKQVLYDQTSGLFSFDTSLSALSVGESVDIYFLN